MSEDAVARIAKLRAMPNDADWGDKFYAALEALETALGKPVVAQARPPHQVMADRIDDARWHLTHSDAAEVEKLRSAAELDRMTMQQMVERDQEVNSLLIAANKEVERLRRVAARIRDSYRAGFHMNEDQFRELEAALSSTEAVSKPEGGA